MPLKPCDRRKAISHLALGVWQPVKWGDLSWLVGKYMRRLHPFDRIDCSLPVTVRHRETTGNQRKAPLGFVTMKTKLPFLHIRHMNKHDEQAC